MPKKAHTEEQIVAVLQRGQAGEKVADICRKVGTSEGTYYAWKKQFAGSGITELRELRQLREENSRLKRLVADLSLDRQILQCQKSSKARIATEAGTVGPANISDRAAASGQVSEARVVDVAVQEKSSAVRCRVAADAVRAGGQARALWLSTFNGATAARRLESECETHLSAVHRGAVDRSYQAATKDRSPFSAEAWPGRQLPTSVRAWTL